MVRLPTDAIQHRIAQIQIRRSHVDLGAQHARAVGEFTGTHAAEQIEALLRGAVAVRAFAPRLCEGAAVLPDLVGSQVVDVGLVTPDQLFGPQVQLLEVV
jgi:hypothetical protein